MSELLAVSLQFRRRRLLRLMMALEGGIMVMQAELLTWMDDQSVAVIGQTFLLAGIDPFLGI